LQSTKSSPLESIAAIFLSSHCDYEKIQQPIHSLRQISGNVTILLTGSRKDSIKKQNEYVFFIQPTSGAERADLMLAVARAIELAPKSEHFFIFENSHDLAFSKKDLVKIQKKRLDYLRSNSGGFFISRRYASFVLSNNHTPSANDALKHGFTANMSLGEMVRSPRDAVRHYWTILKFALVGASGVGVNLFVLFLLKSIAGVLLANAIALELSLMNNFVWNDTFTFNSVGLGRNSGYARFKRFVKYNLVSLFSFGVNESILYIAYSRFHIFYITSEILAIAVAFVINYLGSSKWAWARTLGSAKD
jgi:putative flippase GtrA